MTNWHDKINEHQKLQKPFVLFRTPGSQNVEAWFSDGASDSDESAKSGFVFAPFALGKRLFLDSDRCEKFVFKTPETTVPEMPTVAPTGDFSSQPYTKKVARAVREMQAGKFEKVVLSRAETIQTDAQQYATYFERLLVLYPNAMVYLWFHPISGLWMGATPETLLRHSEASFYTMALAGTRAFVEGEMPDFTQKEREEQQFVTDFIVSGLQRFTTNVNCSKTYEVRAGNLWHLRTDISAQLPGNQLERVVAILHPTPAVCGMPKDIAREYILANEGYDRRYYSGYFGLWNWNETTDLYVNLRCASFEGDKATLFMGCGITAQSIPENEYIETLNKSETMRRALADETLTI